MNDESTKERLRAFLEGLRYLTQFQDCKVINVNTRGSTGDAPLKVTVVREDLTAVKDLLDAGADPNIQGEDDYTPLHHAVSNDNLEIIRLLLAHGASTKIKDFEGVTPTEIARIMHNNAALTLLDAPASLG